MNRTHRGRTFRCMEGNLTPGALCIYEPRTKDGGSCHLSPALAFLVSVAPSGRCLVMLERDSRRFRWVPCHWVRPWLGHPSEVPERAVSAPVRVERESSPAALAARRRQRPVLGRVADLSAGHAEAAHRSRSSSQRSSALMSGRSGSHPICPASSIAAAFSRASSFEQATIILSANFCRQNETS